MGTSACPWRIAELHTRLNASMMPREVVIRDRIIEILRYFQIGPVPGRIYYSCRSASIGSSPAARLAGQIPNTIPTVALNPKAITAEPEVTAVCQPA